MRLYFSPLACSAASRIVCQEAGLSVDFVEVDAETKTTADGRDFRQIHPLGLVPALELDDQTVITENGAVLQYLGGLSPDAALVPRDGMERVRLWQWLHFIGTELHKTVFVPLLDRDAHPAVHARALAKVGPRLDWLATHLEDREFLLDRFGVADAYLVTVLNWTRVTPIDLSKWPAVDAYVKRVMQRPGVIGALASEFELFVAELRRHGRLDAATAQTLGIAL